MNNRYMKKAAMLLMLMAAIFLTACGASQGTNNDSSSQEENNEKENSGNDAKTYKIGVTQFVEHPSLNAALDGFKKALEDEGLNVEYDIQNAQNDTNNNPTIAANLVNGGVDLIFANSTPSAQSVKSATNDIPIVFTSVTDAVGAELVDSMESPGGNVTGTVDLHPDGIKDSVDFLNEGLEAKNIGMIYNAGEQNSVAQVNTVKELMEGTEMKVIDVSVSTTAEVKQAAESLLGKIDAFYIITDNTVVSALESVISVANENKIPLMVGEPDSVEKGGLVAYGIDYHTIGYATGEMAIKILTGESKPADLPVQYPEKTKLVINKKTAETIGFEIKDEWNAEIIE